MEYGNDRIFPLLWDFPLAPDEDGKSMELQQDGSVLLKCRGEKNRALACPSQVSLDERSSKLTSFTVESFECFSKNGCEFVD